MSKVKSRTHSRILRHKRCRKNISGTSERPRMCVFISNKHAYTQVIDDTKGATLCAASTLGKDLRDQVKDMNMTDTAALLGKTIAEKAQAAGIKEIVFDRGGNRYCKRLKAMCDAAREAGLVF